MEKEMSTVKLNPAEDGPLAPQIKEKVRSELIFTTDEKKQYDVHGRVIFLEQEK